MGEIYYARGAAREMDALHPARQRFLQMIGLAPEIRSLHVCYKM
jgi:hypothetical protein